MTDTGSFPLQHIFKVDDLKADGNIVNVGTTPGERDALAKFLDLPAIHKLSGSFKITGNERRIMVRGEVKAEVQQICTVSLEPFDVSIVEEVEVEFADAGILQDKFSDVPDLESELNIPDELVGGQIDLGALTAEFLALGLDPYPRKPGAEFTYKDEFQGSESPFAALTGLKQSPQDNKE